MHRRSPAPDETSKVPTKEFIDADSSKWAPQIASLAPAPSICFSAMATTRASAGGFDKQYALEHDLVLEIAKSAKKAGTTTYVLISGTGASPNAMFAYSKMKGEIEEHIKELGFEHTILVRPGLIAGERAERRVAEAAIRKIAAGLGRISTTWLKDGWAQDADVIARASVAAALRAEKGEIKHKVTILTQAEIIRYGRTEWKGLG